MSSDATKKRRVATDSGDGIAVAAGMEDIIAEMKAQMTRMQNEMDDANARAVSLQDEVNSMKPRLAQFEEMEARCEYLEKSMKTENIFLKAKDRISKMNELEAKCESLERSMKILSDEQKWEYSAPDIPESHWEERGFDEDYIEDMKNNFLDKIKEATCELRSGKEFMGVLNDRWITVGNDNASGMDVGIPILLHDDALLPHWKELANALQLYQNSGFTYKLSIEHVQLTSSVLKLLAPALKESKINRFILDHNEFANIREGIEFAVETFKSIKALKNFVWASNTIESVDDVNYFVGEIISHPSIDDVWLDNCFGEGINGYDILRSILSSGKSFKSIGSGNNIQTGGGTAISDYLATNPTLTELNLRNNHVNDEDAVLIARALKHNSNLQFLFLEENDDITDIGCNALSKALYDTTSLNLMSDCNHTCSIEGIDLYLWLSLAVAIRVLQDYRRTARENRRCKIYHLLSVRNREVSNMRHLNFEFGDDDEHSLALVPRVLECVNRYADDGYPVNRTTSLTPPLSIMYEILRSWKMPELYELR